MMKRTLSILVVVLSMFYALTATANDSIITNNSSNKQIIKVGYNSNTGLVSNIDLQGREGYGYEILKKIETISNLKFEFVEVDGSPLKALKNGEIDVTGLFIKTPERAKEYLYLQTPVFSDTAALVTKGDKGTYYDDPQSIDGKIVATYPGNPIRALLDKYLKEHNISVSYVEALHDDYLQIDADFYFAYASQSSSLDLHTVLNLGMYHTYLVSTFENTEMMDKVNKYMLKLVNEEGFWFTELAVKYTSNPRLTHRELTREEAEFLKGKTFTAGYANNHAPYSYTDKNGNANGAIISVLNFIAEKYDFKIDYIPYSVEEEHLIKHETDIIVSLLGCNTRTSLGFQRTEPYYYLQMTAIAADEVLDKGVSRGEILNNINKIGSLKYLNVNYDAFTSKMPGVDIEFFYTFDDLLQAYQKGDVQLALFTNTGVRYANAVLDGGNHTFAADFSLPARFAINDKYANILIPIFNVIFDNIPEQQYDDILLAHTAEYYPKNTIMGTFKKYWYGFVIPLLAMLLIFLWSSLRQYRARQTAVQNMLDNDDLTGGISMHKFRQLADEMLRNAKPNQYEIVTFDIDSFRTINTYYTLDTGNSVLKAITDVLKTEFNGKNAICARGYSDVFSIIREKDNSLSIETLTECILVPNIVSAIGTDFKVSISAGTYTVENPAKELHIMLDYANVARQAGKGILKTTVYNFDSHMQKMYETKLNVTFRMEKALLKKEFFLMYQPKIDINTLRVIGAEALVRWRTREGKMIFPDQFIPEFEQNGFINKLDTYVFEEVCIFINANRGKLQLPVISVNLSALTFFDEFIVDKLTSIVELYSINPSEIELEITESAMVTSESEIISKVKQFKSEGFTVSVDDFGAGVSSLNRLGTLDVDVLKMDKAFLDNVANDNNNSLVIESTIKLAKDLGMKVVAEGVETAAQAIWLRGLGCDIAQGYYFERPVETQAFIEILATSKAYKL